MRKAYQSILPALLGLLAFASCTLENQDGLRYPTAESVIGHYKGFVQEGNDSTDKQTAHATVGMDSIFISDMAIGEIMQILADNHSMDSIRYPEEIHYSMRYKRRINLTFDSVWVKPKPDSLRIAYDLEDSIHRIKMLFSAPEHGSYRIPEQKMTLSLQANKLIINEDTLQTFTSIPYQILLKKQ